jgi:hypothetical protein
MELRIKPAITRPGVGVRPFRTVSACGERGAELTFGRGSQCDLVIPLTDYFSRTHGRFYFDGDRWRVRREGSSELRMWFDFGGPVTCHGPGSDLALPVSEGVIAFRPPGTEQDVSMTWTLTGEHPADAGLGADVTKAPPARLARPVEQLSPRFIAFLLVLCHRHLLKVDYTAPSVDELALWASSKRGKPLQVDTIRTEYLARLRGILQNMAGSRTFAQREGTDAVRQHAELAVMAQDVMDMRMLDCDQLIEQIRAGVLPNFPDLGWAEGKRG